MTSIKKMLFAFILLTLVGGPVLASTQSSPNQGVFTSVDGKVTVKTKKGHKSKKAEKDLTVFEGDRVIANENSKATIRLFDGSSLEVSPKTEFVLSKLKKQDDGGKTISFKLIVGQLLAAVEKLTTSKSSFEIEAGGVVCGVRGTKLSVKNSGGNNPQVQLHVFEGIVYTVDTHGHKYFFHPGPPIRFVGGSMEPGSKPQGNSNGNGGNKGNNNNGGDTTGLQDLGHQFGNDSTHNGNKDLNSSQGSVINIKPVVGN